MSVPSWVDSRLILYGVGLAVAGVLAYARLDVLGQSMARVQTTLDDQADGLAEHVSSPDHATRGLRVSSLETDQGKLESRVEQMDTRQQKMDRNMVALCVTMGASCE